MALRQSSAQSEIGEPSTVKYRVTLSLTGRETMSASKHNGGSPGSTGDLFTLPPGAERSPELAERLSADIAASGLEAVRDPELAKAIGMTMFDVSGSEDNTVTVLLPQKF